MKSNISGLFLLFIILTSIASGQTSVVSKDYIYYKSGSTWMNAQSFCKIYHTDLATIYTQTDINNLDLKNYFAWVSLYSGHWSDNCPAIYYNDKRKAQTGKQNDNVVSFQSCEIQLFFICQSTDNSEQIIILEAKTWSQAQEYCNQHVNGQLKDLSNSNLNSILFEKDFPIWIGLHRNGGSGNWSSGFSNFINWTSGEPSNNSDCVSISSVTMKMTTRNCDTSFPFICMSENVLLVKEIKSWEEALEYCRGLTSPTNSSLHFDLLSVQPGDEHDYVMDKVMEADTEEVWTGLRFLAGEWLWVNGADVLYPDLPVDPIRGRHCGALSKYNTDTLSPTDCLERQNFLCYGY